MPYPSTKKLVFTVALGLYSLLFFFPVILQAQNYYFEDVYVSQGLDYYASAEGQALVMDSQGNSFSYFDDFFSKKFKVVKLDSNTNLLWANIFEISSGSNNTIILANILMDNQDNIYLYGTYQGSFDADPGAGTYQLSSSSYACFMIKLDNNGNFILAKSLGNGSGVKAVMDTANNSYVLTKRTGLQDLDPDTAVYNINFPTTSIAIQKLDDQGNLVWAKGFPTDSSRNALPSPYTIETDIYSNVYLIVEVSDSFDVDPDTLVEHYVYSPSGIKFLLKLDSQGDFQWVHPLAQKGIWNKLESDPEGNIYLAGLFTDTIDADPTANVIQLISRGSHDFCLLKFNSNGGFIWAKSAGSPSGDKCQDIFYHKGKLFLLGYMWTAGDVSLAPTFDTIPQAVFLQVLDTTGNYLGNHALSGFAHANKVVLNNDETVYITGGYGDIDFDPSLGHAHFRDGPGGLDYFFLKLSKDSCKALDVNKHTQYLNCQDTGIASVTPVYGLGPYQYRWSTGETDSMIYYDSLMVATVTVTDVRGCIVESTIYLEGPKNISPGIEVEPYFQGAGRSIRPGQARIFNLMGINHLCTPADGCIYIVLDSLTPYVGGANPPDSIIGDTLFWNYTGLTYDSEIRLSFLVRADSFIVMRTNTSYEVGMHTTGLDIDSSNNIKHYQGLIINSYDPNIKTAYPEGACASKFVEKDKKLTYTIDFQNTGTASAVNIKIVDTLPVSLDIYSLNMIEASHNYRLEIVDNHILEFYFDRIYLPDSNFNEPASHGYIMFDIEAVPNLVGEVPVENNAAIYFDLNPPIVTNTELRTLIDSLPVLNSNIGLFNNSLVAQQSNALYQWVDCDNNNSFLTGETSQVFSPTQNGSYAVWIENGTCTVLSACFDYIFLDDKRVNQSSSIKVFPNPANNIIHLRGEEDLAVFQLKISDAWGRVVLEKTAEGKVLDINISKLPAGVYHLFYFDGKVSRSTKFVKMD